MDNLKHDTHSAMKHSMPKESIFSGLEKQAVRKRIRNLEHSTHKPKNYKHLIPKAMTGIAVTMFLTVTGGFIANNLGLLHISNQESPVSGNSERDFYPDLKDGDYLNGWKLISKGPSNVQTTSKHSYLLQANFSGSAKITGKVEYFGEDDPIFPSKLIFTPNEESLSKLPVQKNTLPKITFDWQDQEQLKKITGVIAGGPALKITIEVNSYRAQQKGNVLLPAVADLGSVVTDPNLSPNSTPFALLLDTNGMIVLPSNLENIYKEFPITKESELLRKLQPSDIFQLYLYSGEQEDYETQYALFIKDEEYLRPFETVEAYKKAVTQTMKQRNNPMDEFKKGSLLQVMSSNNSCYISIKESKDSPSFSMVRNMNHIWTVNWLPLQ